MKMIISITLIIQSVATILANVEGEPSNFTATQTSTTLEEQPAVITTPLQEARTTKIIPENPRIDELLPGEEHPYWYNDALKDIAYYLRAHKFNEYDRRYNREGTNVERTNFKYFPKPPLRALHWEVKKYCEPSFLHCVDYLRKKLKNVAIRRQDDTAIVAQESNLGPNASIILSQVDLECRRMRDIDNRIAPPFEGPLERYQWRSTASYYMCWYTMNEVPDLQHIDEHCDNFAYCMDLSTGPNNLDVRANNSEPYACAQYSFCPDPCCPNKQLPRKEMCWQDEKNPCFSENPEGHRICGFNRSQNTDFSDIILNRWNVSCSCSEKGYVWSSLYGICVDVDECADEDVQSCNDEGQACLNLPGKYTCVCKWGYVYSEKDKKCVISVPISKIKLNSKPKEEKATPRDRWEDFMKAVLSVIGKPSSASVIKIPQLVFKLNLILCFIIQFML
ncbi:unnamed protein product [Ceutorhynchus assimilis]|uniref:EGF-like domain-containing protein n=1 Tax=Ceutorhynchus assimilis TaxID=467358 RepID=A0A9N9MXB1_9CUCU|nr:unnamed protein product [Ceutorhynchus assimilis]